MIAATRADLWLASVTAGAGLVLTLHRVRPHRPSNFAPNAALEITPENLIDLLDEIAAAGLEIVGIDEVLARMRSPTSRRFVVLTFDDGYRDNIDVAHPILREKGAPWTMFVVADYLKQRGRPWWLELELAIARLDRIQIHVGRVDLDMGCATPSQKYVAYEALRRVLHGSDEEGRRAILDEIGTSAPSGRAGLVAATFASAAEVADLAKGGTVTIGSHTLSHNVLSRCTWSSANREIRRSKSEIAQLIGQDIRHIAFPHGDRTSNGRRESDLAAAAGYDTAWTTRASHLSSPHLISPWSLPRVSINGRHASRAMYRAVLSGAAFPLARHFG